MPLEFYSVFRSPTKILICKLLDPHFDFSVWLLFFICLLNKLCHCYKVAPQQLYFPNQFLSTSWDQIECFSFFVCVVFLFTCLLVCLFVLFFSRAWDIDSGLSFHLRFRSLASLAGRHWNIPGPVVFSSLIVFLISAFHRISNGYCPGWMASPLGHLFW